MRIFSALLAVSILLPVSAFAEEDYVTRRNGFVRIWDTVLRPAYETRDTFDDMPDAAYGALEINYARRRGLIDDESDTFHPDEYMTLHDAVIWLMRTRNVDDVDDMERSHLEELLTKYPLVDTDENFSRKVTIDELESLITEFDDMLNKEVHEFSLYAEYFQGKGTAFGESFDMNAYTAAHRTFPHNTLVKVTNERTGKAVIVRINDRGPFVEGRDMDLSLASFLAIEERSKGVAYGTFERLGDSEMLPHIIPGPVEQDQELDITPVEKDRQNDEEEVVEETDPAPLHRSACIDPVLPKYQKRLTRDVHFRRGVPHTFYEGEELLLQANKPFVLRGVTYPDGTFTRMQDFILEDESFSFIPVELGQYTFTIGSVEGRIRDFQMTVQECTNQ